MAPVPLKSIVSVSSEDKSNPASNLLCSGNGGGNWLCAADNRSGKAEVVIELSKRARITSLEICNFGSAFVEILVSDSSSGPSPSTPSGPSPSTLSGSSPSSSGPTQDITLLHMSMFMSFQESRMGRNKNKTITYTKDRLSATATSKKWNRVKIRCVQKYNLDSQFGLKSVSFFTDAHNPNLAGRLNGGVASPLLSPPSSLLPCQSSQTMPKQESPHSDNKRHQNFKYPSLPSLKSPTSTSREGGGSHRACDTKSRSQTPKRISKDRSGVGKSEEDFEFSGVEKQSRLLHGCLKGKSDDSTDKDKAKGQNQILERIAADKDKYREMSSPLYQRRRLLKRELPKAEAMRDFVESYRDRKISAELSGAARKLSSHDNDYEIGEEPEMTWGWDKFKGRPKGRRGKRPPCPREGVWITKRRKKLDSMIEECSDIFKRVGQVERGCGLVTCIDKEDTSDTDEKLLVVDEDMSDEDTPALVDRGAKAVQGAQEGDHPSSPPGSGSSPLVECPLCMAFFPSYAIEVHASVCGETLQADTLSTGIITID